MAINRAKSWEASKRWRRLAARCVCFLLVLLTCFAPNLARSTVSVAQAPPIGAAPPTPEEKTLYYDYGGWVAVGGALTFAGVATASTYAINAIRKPEPGIDCEMTPEACQLSTWNFIWTMTILAAAASLVAVGAWGTGVLARHLEANQRLGWGLAGTIAAMPTGALIGFSIPQYSPDWTYFTMVSLITAGTMVGGGFYLDWIAQKRGHAWPEFTFGIVGSVAGSTVGSLICGSRPCNATFIMGAVGGIMGFGLSTLIWGFPDATVKEEVQQRRNGLYQSPSQQPRGAMLQYSFPF